MEPAIHIENLTKIYKLQKKQTRTAVDSLNIDVPEGVIFGFLGANGAGKTTTIKSILDFLNPSSGTITIFGKSSKEASSRKLIGYLPEQPYFHKFLKPVEIVSMHASLAGINIKECHAKALTSLDRVGIAEYAQTPVSKLSKGLTQRVGIAQAIVGDPKLLILDEPTSGLDPIGRRHIRDLLIELKNEGKTIFLSSHLLSEVENLCDKIAVMKRGKLITSGTPDEVRSAESMVTITTSIPESDVIKRLRFTNYKIDENSNSILIKTTNEDIFKTIKIMEEHKLPVLKIETLQESLEEAFLRLAA